MAMAVSHSVRLPHQISMASITESKSLYTFNASPTSTSTSTSTSLPFKLSFHLSLRRTTHRRFRVSMALPTANPERALIIDKSSPNWSARAIKSFCMGRMEARKMKYMNIGTESLIMGILADGTSAAAKLLRANGINLFSVKIASTKVLGQADYYTPVPEPPPPTKTLLQALDNALDMANDSAGECREVTTTHMLLAIWAIKGSAGEQILSDLGFNDKLAEELANMVSESGWD